MIEIISVRFRNGSKNYDFDPNGMQIRTGDDVIVETAQGIEFASCTRGNHLIPESAVVRPLSAVLRLATDADRRTMEYHQRREADAFGIAEKKIADHGLEMKLVSVSSGFEGNKIIFFFTADGRVDFRALVRDLASVFRSRIELRQIGVRDEARMVGGLGICGRPFCCAQFLDTFLPVSIKMAKTQNLSLNPAKISGACGRLMCCLKYEQYAYEDAARRLPKVESFVQTPDGPGNVKAVDLLRETVKVSLDGEPEPYRTYHADEIVLLRGGKGSREGIDLPPRPARHVEERREETAFEPVFLDNYQWDGDAPSYDGGTPPAVPDRNSGSDRNSVPDRKGGRNAAPAMDQRDSGFPSPRGGRNAVPAADRRGNAPMDRRGNAFPKGGRNAAPPLDRRGGPDKNNAFPGRNGMFPDRNSAAGYPGRSGPVPARGGLSGPQGNAPPASGSPMPYQDRGNTPYQNQGGAPCQNRGPAAPGPYQDRGPAAPYQDRKAVPLPPADMNNSAWNESSGPYGRNPPPTAEDWADFESMSLLSPYAVDENDERHRNRNQSGRRGKMDQRGGKFQKQGREYQRRENSYDGGDQKRRGNRNYYRGNRRNRGGKAPD